jgi:hypothetical protein
MRYIFLEETREGDRIQNSQQMADAFDETEWARIANYWITRSGLRGGPSADFRSFGDNGLRVRRNLQAFNNSIGNSMPNITASDWITRASRYGITGFTPNEANWGAIYRKLIRGVNFDLPDHFDDDTPATNAVVLNTTETLNDISQWVPTNSTGWSDPIRLREDYIRPWVRQLFAIRDNNVDDGPYRVWFETSTVNGNDNYARVTLFATRDRLVDTIERDGSITKRAVDQALYTWLRNADNLWANSQRD